MNAIKLVSSVFVASALLWSAGEAAEAAPVPIACGTAIDNYFSGRQPGGWLNVIGSELTARGGMGFSTFTMADGYSLAANPLNTPGAAARSTFIANKGSSQYNGVFSEVFPGRGNNDVDRTEFWIYRTGALWLRSLTWDPATWHQVQGVTCSQGPQGQTVITGYAEPPGFGTTFYTFVVQGEDLI